MDRLFPYTNSVHHLLPACSAGPCSSKNFEKWSVHLDRKRGLIPCRRMLRAWPSPKRTQWRWRASSLYAWRESERKPSVTFLRVAINISISKSVDVLALHAQAFRVSGLRFLCGVLRGHVQRTICAASGRRLPRPSCFQRNGFGVEYTVQQTFPQVTRSICCLSMTRHIVNQCMSYDILSYCHYNA